MSPPSEEKEVASSSQRRIWKCGCGKVQLQLTGDPFIASNCHCRSCVSSVRFLDEKHQKEESDNSKEYTSGIDKSTGGAAGTFFMPNQVEPITELSPGMFGFTKVGPSGKAVRRYVTCCGTPFGVVNPSFYALNRNAIYNTTTNDDDDTKDGKSTTATATTTKFEPEEAPVNCMKKYAFEPDSVPEPSASMAGFGDLLKFMFVLINPFGPSVDKDVQRNTTPDPACAEVVPITWE